MVCCGLKFLHTLQPPNCISSQIWGAACRWPQVGLCSSCIYYCLRLRGDNTWKFGFCCITKCCNAISITTCHWLHLLTWRSTCQMLLTTAAVGVPTAAAYHVAQYLSTHELWILMSLEDWNYSMVKKISPRRYGPSLQWCPVLNPIDTFYYFFTFLT